MKQLTLLKKCLSIALVVVFAVVLSSCRKSKLDNTNATFIFKATNSSTGGSSENSVLNNGVLVESFKINIEEVELEFDDDDPRFATDSVASDIELKGPFEIDLIQNQNLLEQTIGTRIEVPVGVYDEIEFKFREGKVTSSVMNGKSIRITGTINGTPFIFWSDNEIELEAEFEQNLTLDEIRDNIIVVTFDIAALVNPSKGGVDITGAMDRNNNGLIEIFFNDPDGNGDLARQLWNRLEAIIDAFDERFDN